MSLATLQTAGSVLQSVSAFVKDYKCNTDRVLSALSPTPPFPQEAPRLKLAGTLVPVLAVGLLTTSAIFMKATYAGIGFGFFGDPLIWRGLDFLNKKIPNWQKYLELRKYVEVHSQFGHLANIFQLHTQRHPYKRSAHGHPPPYWRSEQGSPTSTSSLRPTSSVEACLSERRRPDSRRVTRGDPRSHSQGPCRKGSGGACREGRKAQTQTRRAHPWLLQRHNQDWRRDEVWH